VNQAQTYETAVARLEAIIRRLDSGEAGLRETLELIREGRELRLDELVARLETRGQPPQAREGVE
jgi:exodeoxyribonuclease VII small subunit